MSIVTFRCREERLIKISLDEFKFMDDFFLKNMILDCEDSDNILELNEDFNVVNSIIESLRLKMLIYNNHTSLSYMLGLSEKWCVSDWLLNEIREEMKESKVVKMLHEYDLILSGGYKKCKLCGIGFRLSENKSDSCKRHKFNINTRTGEYQCCKSTEYSNFCLVGFHVPDNTDNIQLHRNLLENT